MSRFATSEDRARVMKFVRQSLQDKLFIGRYTERRLVEPLIAYKDVIEIDSKELEFISTLRIVNEKLKQTFNEKFVNSIIGNKNDGFSILTNLSDVAFGSHWFKIVDVKLDDFTITINVKWLRSSAIEEEPLSTASLMELWNNFSISNFLYDFIVTLLQVLTKENIIYSVRLLCALFLSAIVGCYRLLELFLRFFNELNNTLKVLQPIFIAGIEALTKAFGGLLILITYMWRGESAKNIPNFQNLSPNVQKFKPIQYKRSPPNNGDFRNQAIDPSYGFNNRFNGYGYQRNYRRQD